MIRSSLPESSPFTTTDLPMVATSWLRKLSLRVASGGRVGALRGGLKAGTGGPGSGPGVVGSSSLRFHIRLCSTRSRPPASRRPRRPSLGAPKPLARAYPTGSAAANHFADKTANYGDFRATPEQYGRQSCLSVTKLSSGSRIIAGLIPPADAQANPPAGGLGFIP